MVPFIIAGFALLGISLAGCAHEPPVQRRKSFPDQPSPDDILAHDPCTVKQTPDIVFRNEQISLESKQKLESRLKSDLSSLRKINPIFLCGLDRIELDGTVEFAQADRSHPDRAGHYDDNERAIRIRLYSKETLFHEIGHHVHNLGILAPLVMGVRASSWEKDQTMEEWVKKGKGESFFISDYAETNPIEDWAETFSYGTSFPLEVGLEVYLNRSYQTPSSLRQKFALIYQSISNPLRQKEVSIHAGEPLHFMEAKADGNFLDGRFLYLYGKGLRDVSRLDLSHPDQAVPVNGLRELLNEPIDSSYVEGHQIGHHFVGLERDLYFRPTQGGPGTGLVVIDLKQGKRVYRYQEDETFLGEMKVMGDQLGYFNRKPDLLEFKKFDPQKKKSELEKTWSLPEGFIPLHIVSLKDLEDFVVVGQKGEEQIMQILHLTQDTQNPSQYNLQEGGSVDFPIWRWDSLRTPVMMGDHLIFPFEGFRFLDYDLSRNEFALLHPRFEGASLDWDRFRKIIAHQGKLYALGSATDGSALLAPLEIQF